MGKKLDQAFATALANVQLDEERIAALHFAMGEIREQFTETDRGQFDRLHCLLYSRLHESYRSLFMWAHITHKEEHIQEARRIAYDHYLKKNAEIMSYLELEHGYPGSYQMQEEEAFRREIEEMEPVFKIEE